MEESRPYSASEPALEEVDFRDAEETLRQEPQENASPSYNTKAAMWAMFALGVMAVAGILLLVQQDHINSASSYIPIEEIEEFILAQAALSDRNATRNYVETRGLPSFTREDAMKCILDYVDGLRQTKDSKGKIVYVFGSKDGCISEDEITYAKTTYLTLFERSVASLETNAKIMRNCDFDMAEEDRLGKPHCIDRTDMIKSNKTCLNDSPKLNKLNTYICRRATARYGDDK